GGEGPVVRLEVGRGGGHERDEALAGGGGPLDRVHDRVDQPVERRDDDRVEDLVLRAEVVVDARLRDPDRLGEPLHADVLEALAREQLGRAGDDAVALVVVERRPPRASAELTVLDLTGCHGTTIKPSDRLENAVQGGVMRRKLSPVMALAVAVVAAMAALPNALGGPAVPGLTARTVTIGGTFPLSGPASSYAPI